MHSVQNADTQRAIKMTMPEVVALIQSARRAQDELRMANLIIQQAAIQYEIALDDAAHHRLCRTCSEDGCQSCYDCKVINHVGFD